MGLAFTYLRFLALNTTVRVLSDVRLDIRPPVVSGDEFLSFVAAWMSGSDGVVMRSNDVFAKLFVSGDVEAFLPFDRGMRR